MAQDDEVQVEGDFDSCISDFRELLTTKLKMDKDKEKFIATRNKCKRTLKARLDCLRREFTNLEQNMPSTFKSFKDRKVLLSSNPAFQLTRNFMAAEIQAIDAQIKRWNELIDKIGALEKEQAFFETLPMKHSSISKAIEILEGLDKPSQSGSYIAVLT